MAKIPRIQFKRTKTPGTKPSKDILAEGELAINLADRTLFTKSGDDIIDLGFAKGGTVNGDINQETGNFTTNGSMTAKTYIDIKNSLNDKKIFRLSYEGDRGALLSVNEGDNKWKTILVPLDEDGTKTIATREHVAKMVSTSSGETKLRAPNQTNVLIAKDNKELVWYDVSTNNRMVNFGAGGLDLAHKGSDIVGVSLYKKDGNQVRIETHAHSSDLMLAFAYKDSAGNNSYVINMPKENGILATQGWTDTKYYKRNDSPSFKEYVNVFHNTTGSYTQLGYGNAGATWSVNTGGNWYILKHPLANGTVASQEWTNTFVNRTGADTYIQSADGKHWLTIVNDGMFSVWHNDTKQRSFYVETGGAAVAAHSVRAPSIMATRGASELFKLGFNATGSPFLSYFDTAGKWTGYYFPNSNGGTVASQEWSNSNHYKKTETYNKSEIDGKVNGRLTQAQGDARYVRMDLTNLGKQFTPLTGIASGQWGKPIGYSVMVNSASSPQRPPNTGYGYWHVIGARDQSNGYAGIWGGYSDGQMYYGNGNTAATNPTWYKIYTSGNKPSPSELGVYAKGEVYSKAESDARYPLKTDVYAKGETYSRGEVDSRVNGRLTQAQGDARYPLKDNVYTKAETDGRFIKKGETQGLGPIVKGSERYWGNDSGARVENIARTFAEVPANAVFCGVDWREITNGISVTPKWRVIK